MAAAAISIASDIRPTPASLDSAISPALGPIMWTPSRRSCSTLRRVAALFHIRGFIAGASRIGRSGRQQDCAGEIVGVAVRHLRHQVGGRRRHHDQIAFAREADVTGVEFALGVEQIGVDALMRQRAGRKRRDELLRGLGQHAADVDVPLLQPPDQLQRFEGGDAAADDQGDAGAGRSP